MIILVEITYHLRNNKSFSLIYMFNFSLKHAVDRPILKGDFIRYTPPSLNLVNGEITQNLLIYLEKIVPIH